MEAEMEATYPTPTERKRLGAVVGGGASLEAIAGLAVATLAILGLARVLSFYTLTIAMIVAGAALFIDGILVGGAYRELQRAQTVHDGKYDQIDVMRGFGAQVLGGAIAVIVGIMALGGAFSATWAAIAVILLGTALLIGALTHGELDWSVLELRPSASSRRVFRRAVRLAASMGACVVFLGVLSLIAIAGPTGGAPFGLILVALLALGLAEALDGSAVLGRIATKPADPDLREHKLSGLE
jgi:hypothetical protein